MNCHENLETSLLIVSELGQSAGVNIFCKCVRLISSNSSIKRRLISSADVPSSSSTQVEMFMSGAFLDVIDIASSKRLQMSTFQSHLSRRVGVKTWSNAFCSAESSHFVDNDDMG